MWYRRLRKARVPTVTAQQLKAKGFKGFNLVGLASVCIIAFVTLESDRNLFHLWMFLDDSRIA